ncbi:hypothetical protein GJAV_G00255910 [Gymnothorax javanicus]|nr:hypothetical protein GJAV_G00255910 [Gymnothorax javanicus]
MLTVSHCPEMVPRKPCRNSLTPSLPIREGWRILQRDWWVYNVKKTMKMDSASFSQSEKLERCFWAWPKGTGLEWMIEKTFQYGATGGSRGDHPSVPGKIRAGRRGLDWPPPHTRTYLAPLHWYADCFPVFVSLWSAAEAD